MSRRFNIAFVSHRPMSYAQRVVEGITHYVSQHPHLRLQLLGQIGFEPLWSPEEFRGQAVIGLFTSPEQAAPYLEKGALVINVSSATDAISPQVCINNRRSGAMVAEAFLRQGFVNFLYVTTRGGDTVAAPLQGRPPAREGTLFNRERLAGFREVLQKSGRDCRVLSLSQEVLYSRQHWIHGLKRLADYLQESPRPLAVFCLNDIIGRLVLQACQRNGLQVPGEVAVAGIDNDELMCRSIEPNLSSVEQGEDRVGYEAASLCDRLLHGEKPPAGPVLLDPIELIERQSTSMISVSDPGVAKALQFMKNNLHRPINIEAVLAEVGASRRDFEKRFKKHTGTTPAQELARFRIEKACKALVGTDQPLKDIASACGYKRIERFHEAFRRQMGMPPRAYRQKNRLTP